MKTILKHPCRRTKNYFLILTSAFLILTSTASYSAYITGGTQSGKQGSGGAEHYNCCAIQATFSNNAINCFGDSVYFTSSVTDALGSVSYAWDFGDGQTSTEANPSTVYSAGGNYTVILTVTDEAECSNTATVNITVPDSLTLSFTTTDIGCGNTAGSIDLSVSGGTTPYTYNWSNGATTEDITNLTAGTYSVTVTEANGCTAISSATLTGATSSYSVNSIPYTPYPYRGGTTVPLGDDAVSGAKAIGFDFCFFGNTYNQLYIGSNGWVSFSAGQTTAYRTVPIPDATNKSPKNVIMLPWQDLYSSGGKINYALYGTAPYRKLVVSFDSIIIPCSFAHGFRYYQGQVILNETDNTIDNYISIHDNTCNSMWGTGPLYGVQGIQDITGTIAVTVPGRNNAQWVSVQEGWQYVPSSTTPSFKMLNTPSEVQEFKTDEQITFYPNPATNEITVYVQWDQEKQYQLRFINVLGQEVLKKDFIAQTTINVSDIRPSGLYFIEVTSKTESFKQMKKVVLE